MKTPVCTAFAICATWGLLVFSPAEASAGLSHDIAAQPLAQALSDFAAQTGLQVVYVSSIAANQHSKGAPRGLPPSEALESLLAGTGLRFEYVNERTVRILAALNCTPPLLCAKPPAEAAALTTKPPRPTPPQDWLDNMLQEIVVTARRREERLLDVPISLSVLPDIALERLQIYDVGALQYVVPSLIVTPWPGAPSRVTITMRGQVEPDRFPTVDPAVGVYLDGVYVARMGGANLDFIDMERIEVLRGPQGTLYGRNTIGGAINLIPKRPETTFAAELTGRAGNYDRRDLEAVVNVPLGGDGHAVRVAASHTEHSGYGRNTLLDLDLNDDDTDFLRAQVRLAPADRWDLILSVDYTRTLADVGLVTLLAASPTSNEFPVAAGHPDDRLEYYADSTAHRIRANRGETGESEIRGASAVLELELPSFTVKALSAYRSLDTDDGAKDLDGTPYDLAAITGRGEHQTQWNYELQSYGDVFGGRLNWIGGLHYFEEVANFFEHFHVTLSTTLVTTELRSAGTARNEAAAAYAQLVYMLSPKLRITGGVRYNEDRRQLTSTNARLFDGVESCALVPELRDVPDLCRATLPKREFSYSPWTFGVDVAPMPDALLYAKVSRGHRAGGYNFRAVTGTEADTFEPEQVTTFEIGTRAELFDRRLRLALSLYRSLFEDMQVRTKVSLPNGVVNVALTQNAAESRIDGGELEVEALLGRLTLSAMLGVTHGKYTKIDPDAIDVTLNSPLLYMPETTTSLAANLPIHATFGAIALHADYAWRDDQTFATWETLARQDAYGLLNAMLAARFDGTDFELQLWGRNLTDERYIQRAVDLGSLVNAVPGDPRTYGVSLIYRFGDR